MFTEILFAGLQFVLTVSTELCRAKFLGSTCEHPSFIKQILVLILPLFLEADPIQ